MLAVAAAQDAVRLLSFLREQGGDGLEAFELIQDRALAFVLRHIPSTRSPFDVEHPWYVLLEASDASDPDRIGEMLGRALERSLAVDAVVAKNAAEAAELWRIRHSISEAQKYEGASLKHDVSVPVGRIGDFIERAQAAIAGRLPGARVVAFGHVGDGNVHLNVSQPADWHAERFREEGEALTALVYELVAEFEGSISAEHGIGQAKKHWLRKYRGPVDLALMQALKQALDPANLLNPGKVL
jgi:FAD/FMN-containing dehydrogenase